MRQRADREGRLIRRNQFRHGDRLDRAVGMLDRHRPAGHALQRVQHDEADTVGQEIARRAAFGAKHSCPDASPSMRAS